jgi:hypothetical protein
LRVLLPLMMNIKPVLPDQAALGAILYGFCELHMQLCNGTILFFFVTKKKELQSQ